MYANYLALKKKVNIKEEITKSPNFDSLRVQLKQEK